MRKIEREVCGAFVRFKRKASGNTVSTGTELLLHNNVIAKWGSDKRDGNLELYISLAGWNTPTTRSRLNAVLELTSTEAYFLTHNKAARQQAPSTYAIHNYPLRIYTKKGEPYIRQCRLDSPNVAIPTNEFILVKDYLNPTGLEEW